MPRPGSGCADHPDVPGRSGGPSWPAPPPPRSLLFGQEALRQELEAEREQLLHRLTQEREELLAQHEAEKEGLSTEVLALHREREEGLLLAESEKQQVRGGHAWGAQAVGGVEGRQGQGSAPPSVAVWPQKGGFSGEAR